MTKLQELMQFQNYFHDLGVDPDDMEKTYYRIKKRVQIRYPYAWKNKQNLAHISNKRKELIEKLREELKKTPADASCSCGCGVNAKKIISDDIKRAELEKDLIELILKFHDELIA